MKNILVILLSVLFLSCDFDVDFSSDSNMGPIESESLSYYTPIFVGSDSILYLEKYTKTRYTSAPYTLASETQFKIMNIQGQFLSANWSRNLDTNPKLLFSNSISYSEEGRKIFINYMANDKTEGLTDDRVMIIDLYGNVVSDFIDKDITYKIDEGMYGLYRLNSSPNGLYYTVNNRIKSTSGDVIKTIDKEILDWNTNGLLVRDTSINMEIVSFEGEDYKMYSHPIANSWFGKDFKFLYFDNDSITIQNWHNSSISNKIYFPYAPDYYYQFNSSMISPDLNYMAFKGDNSGIHLLDLINGDTRTINDLSKLFIH